MRRNSPAPTSSSTESATCATTGALPSGLCDVARNAPLQILTFGGPSPGRQVEIPRQFQSVAGRNDDSLSSRKRVLLEHTLFSNEKPHASRLTVIRKIAERPAIQKNDQPDSIIETAPGDSDIPRRSSL